MRSCLWSFPGPLPPPQAIGVPSAKKVAVEADSAKDFRHPPHLPLLADFPDFLADVSGQYLKKIGRFAPNLR